MSRRNVLAASMACKNVLARDKDPGGCSRGRVFDRPYGQFRKKKGTLFGWFLEGDSVLFGVERATPVLGTYSQFGNRDECVRRQDQRTCYDNGRH